MAVFFLAAIASLAVAAEVPAATPAPRELRATISEALRREATTTGREHEQALQELVTVFEQLAADQQLPEKERNLRIGQVRARLARGADQLAQRIGGPRQPAGNGNAPARQAAP